MELRKCPVCGGKLRSEALGWICYDCQGFIDMKGVFHEHKEKLFMPPMTNADRIRAMSDEELANWLVQKTVYQESAWSEPSYLNFLTSRDDTKENAIKGTVEWLKQPAEVTDNGE